MKNNFPSYLNPSHRRSRPNRSVTFCDANTGQHHHHHQHPIDPINSTHSYSSNLSYSPHLNSQASFYKPREYNSTLPVTSLDAEYQHVTTHSHPHHSQVSNLTPPASSCIQHTSPNHHFPSSLSLSGHSQIIPNGDHVNQYSTEYICDCVYAQPPVDRGCITTTTTAASTVDHHENTIYADPSILMNSTSVDPMMMMSTSEYISSTGHSVGKNLYINSNMYHPTMNPLAAASVSNVGYNSNNESSSGLSFLDYLLDCSFLSTNRSSHISSSSPSPSPQPYSPILFTMIAAIVLVLLMFTSFLLLHRAGSSTYRNPMGIDEKPCEKIHCPFGGTCVLDKVTNKPSCQCLSECRNNLVAPVCGTDNVTYSNECKMHLASCSQRKRISIKYERECYSKDPCANSVCLHGSKCKPSLDGNTYECICPEKCIVSSNQGIERAVCGDDGREYPNSCELRRYACLAMKNISEKYRGKCDPCEGIECPKGQLCRLDDNRNPVCKCRIDCDQNYRPVCASDGRTYGNECMMHSQACQEGREVRVIHEGTCSNSPISSQCQNLNCTSHQLCNINPDGQASCICPSQCPPVMKPVCGSDGETYDSLCDIKRKSCLRTLDITIKHGGPCQPDGDAKCSSITCDPGEICYIDIGNGDPRCRCVITCTEEYDPVCGADGISYVNLCQLRRESCEKKLDIEVDHKGLCGGCDNKLCPHYSVCETDGRGRSVCVCPESCVNIHDPVCGSDGKTYTNECELRVASCRFQTSIVTQSKGTCEECSNITCSTPGSRCEKGLCMCPSECPLDSEEWICASNGISYRNDCELRRASCLSDTELSVKFYGQCKIDTYIGESNSSSSNANSDDKKNQHLKQSEPCAHMECEFGASCRPGTNGKYECVCAFDCDSDSFTNETEIICANNNVFYGNECLMKEAACKLKQNLVKIEPEMCKRLHIPLNGKKCHQTLYGCCPDGETPSLGPWSAGCPDTCNCNRHGSTSLSCDPVTKQCSCKPAVGGLKCDRCEPGYWGLNQISLDGTSGCTPCGCNIYGSVRDDCEQTTGRCVCKNGSIGMKCDICNAGLVLTRRGCMPRDQAENIVIRSCVEIGCLFGAICKQTAGDSICSCDFDCDDSDPFPVCASDNNTYGSACQVKLLACRFQTNITILKEGPCGATWVKSTTTSTTTTTIGPSTSPSTTVLATTIIIAATSDYNESLPVNVTNLTLGQDLSTNIVSSSQPDGSEIQQDSGVGNSLKWFDIPAFNENSYLLLPHVRAKNDLSIELELIVSSYDGIIVYNGQNSHGKGDFVAIIVKDGFIQFRYNLGSGTVIITHSNRIELGRRVKIIARRHHKDGFLSVDGQQPVKASSQGTMRTLDLADFLYIGSIPVITKRIKQNVGGIGFGFTGCMLTLTINRKLMDLKYPSSKVIIKQNLVKNCESIQATGCYGSSTCLHTKSSCLNDVKNQFDCGESNFQRDQSAEVSNHFVPSFINSSFIQLPVRSDSSHSLNFEIWFRSHASDGLLLFGGPNKNSSRDNVQLSLVDNHLELIFDLGSGPAVLRTPENVSLDTWHSVKVVRHRRRGSLQLDKNTIIYGDSKGQLNELNLDSSFYIGGVPKTLSSKLSRDVPFFNGAIQRVVINGQNFEDLVPQSSNLKDIDEYFGPPCYRTESRSSLCLNRGICLPNLDEYSCKCLENYSGRNCENLTINGMTHSSLRFDGESIAKFKNIKKRKIKKSSTTLEITLRTTSSQGLIVWRGRDQSPIDGHISLSIVDGFVELFFLPSRRRKPYKLTSHNKINDGDWHHLQVEWSKKHLKMKLDNRPSSNSFMSGLNKVHREGIFWIGGYRDPPKNSPKHYHVPFVGCINSLRIDDEPIDWNLTIGLTRPLEHCDSNWDERG
ncbi:agrin-like isoform X2 [Brevipalpus obovatus]|uniref:agrin-like isoform X2 n=1 Tax=Brevipalpus obovatus TaxID=246614 RepID=UPI003D9E7B08